MANAASKRIRLIQILNRALDELHPLSIYRIQIFTGLFQHGC